MVSLIATILFIFCIVSSGDIWYTGMLYYEKKKEFGHWKTMYSVVRELAVIQQVSDYIYTGCINMCIAFNKQAQAYH